MGLRELLAEVAAKAATEYVRFDAGTRVLALSPRVVEPAVRHALGRVPALSDASVQLQPDGLRLSACTRGGLRVAATVVPRALELHGESLVARAHLPRGLEVGHESATLGLALGLFDGLLGASEQLVGRHLEGATLRNGAFTYTRPVGELALLRGLRQLGWQLDSRGVVHLDVRDGWLVLDLRDAVPPGTQLDVTRLLAFLGPRTPPG